MIQVCFAFIPCFLSMLSCCCKLSHPPDCHPNQTCSPVSRHHRHHPLARMNNTCSAHISALTHIRGLTMDAGCLFYSDGFKTCHVVAPFCYLDHSSVSTINTRSAHISASHAAGGEPPLPMHSGATHPCTNSAARAAGGESPPLRAHLGDPHPAQVPQLERPRRAHAPLSQSHKLRSSSGRGGIAPPGSA